MTVAVVTDSAAQLPRAWAKRCGVTVLDLHTTEEDGVVAATAALTPEEIGETYRALLEREDISGIVSVHLASKLSRTWASAVEAGSRFGGRVHVVDSQNVGMAIGAAALQAAQLAAEGAALGEVSELAKRAAQGATTWLAVDKMDSLRRGGRVGAAIALFGGALSSKPIVRIRGGSLSLAAKARTVTKALARLREFARDEIAGDALIAVQYTGDASVAEALAWEFRKETTNPERVLVMEIGPVLAWHTGDDAVAVSVCPLLVDLPIPAQD